MPAYLILADSDDEADGAIVEADTPQAALNRWDKVMSETYGADAPAAKSCELMGDFLVLENS